MSTKNNKSKLNNKGFTIVELMIASLVFTLVLLLLTVGFVQVSRLFYKGVTTSKTQETARTIIEDISHSIQFNGGRVEEPRDIDGTGSYYYFCIGGKRFTYRQFLKHDDANNVFIKDNDPSSCTSHADIGNIGALATEPVELMQPNMRLDGFSLEQVGSGNLYKLNVRVVYGDDDVLSGSDGSRYCAGSIITTQFCAVSDLTTTVQKRI